MTTVAPPLSAGSIMMESSCFSDWRAVFSALEMLLFGTFDDLIAPTISVVSWVASLVGNDLHASSVAATIILLSTFCLFMHTLVNSCYIRCAFSCFSTSLGNRSSKCRFLSCRWLIFWFVSWILSRRRFFLAFSTTFLALSELIQGHPTLTFGKYLFGRRFKIYICHKIFASLPLLGFSNI